MDSNFNQDSTNNEPAQVAGPAVVVKQRPHPLKVILKTLGVVLLLALVGGGIWYWQQQKVKDLDASVADLKRQVQALSTKEAADRVKPAGKPENPETVAIQGDVVTGDYTFDKASKNHGVEVLYLPGRPTQVWIEYGTKVDALTNSTERVKATAAGTPGEYLKQGLSISKVTTNTQMFWRAAGIVDGKTVYGGISSFYVSN